MGTWYTLLKPGWIQAWVHCELWGTGVNPSPIMNQEKTPRGGIVPPPIHISTCWLQASSKMTLIWKWILTSRINKLINFQIKMWSLRWMLIWYDWCPYERDELDTDTDATERIPLWRLKQKSEWFLYMLRTPKTTTARRGAWDNAPSRLSEGANTASILILDFQLQELRAVNFCCFSYSVCDTLFWWP